MEVNILVITQTIGEFKQYLTDNLLLSLRATSVPSPFVIENGLGKTVYWECINTDTILSKKFDKAIFISRPKWITESERTTGKNMISYIYDNCVNHYVSRYKYIH